jgi:hypothetical protein
LLIAGGGGIIICEFLSIGISISTDGSGMSVFSKIRVLKDINIK